MSLSVHWDLLSLVMAYLESVNQDARGRAHVRTAPTVHHHDNDRGREDGGRRRGRHSEQRQVLLWNARRPWHVVAERRLREQQHCSDTLSRVCVAFVFVQTRDLGAAGNRATVAMVHHSGSIQSFKQQKGWSLVMWGVHVHGRFFLKPCVWCAVTFDCSLNSLWREMTLRGIELSALAQRVTQSWRFFIVVSCRLCSTLLSTILLFTLLIVIKSILKHIPNIVTSIYDCHTEVWGGVGGQLCCCKWKQHLLTSVHMTIESWSRFCAIN